MVYVSVCVCVVKVGWEEEEQGHNQIINNQMEKKIKTQEEYPVANF